MYINYLQHHGILGMKWGKKNGPPYPLGASDHSVSEKKAGWKKSLNNNSKLSKKHSIGIADAYEGYNRAKLETLEAQKNYNKITLGGILLNTEATKKLEEAQLKQRIWKSKLEYEKNKERYEKNKERDAVLTNKSKHRQNLETEYIKKGLTRDEAIVQAYKREKVEKALAIVGGVTVAALSAYAIYKYSDYVKDQIIKQGTNIQNISRDDIQGVRDSFYASIGKRDNNIYMGQFADSLRGGSEIKNLIGKILNQEQPKTTVNILKKSLTAVSDIKVASEKNATKVLSDLVKQDKDFSIMLKEHIKMMSEDRGLSLLPTKKNMVIKNALRSIMHEKVNPSVYDAFNIGLAHHRNDSINKMHNIFFDKMKELGYDAIRDMNDKKYSGYYARNPLIVFNKDKVDIESVKKITDETINKLRDDFKLRSTLRSLGIGVGGGVAPSIALGAAVGGFSRATNRKQEDKIVLEYRKEHPNSKLSYHDILLSYYKKSS